MNKSSDGELRFVLDIDWLPKLYQILNNKLYNFESFSCPTGPPP